MSTNGKPMEANKEEIVSENGEQTRSRRSFVPRTDIYESEEAIYLQADMPGVQPDSVEIMLEKNLLSIHGMVEPLAPEGYQLAYAEYEDGDFMRRFRISSQIDGDKIQAVLKEGVLQLVLPKTRPEQKKISVKAG